MEPVVQYSQKDPLYDPNQENLDEAGNKNDIAQPKILNVNRGDFQDGPSGEYGPPYGSLPTAPLYSHEPHPHYYEAPEPIIEIIIKESNETLPPPPPQPILKKKKEPVQVFYVKYSKDPYGKDKVIYEKPVPAITPPSNDEDEHHEEYVTVTPEPYYPPLQTTTLRAIIKPESEVYHSDSSVKITFGGDENQNHGHYRREGVANEDREETAPRPAIAYPQQPPTQQNPPKSHDPNNKVPNQQPPYKPVHHAQSRIQYQPTFLSHEQQIPRQAPSPPSFRGQQHVPRQNIFGPSPSHSPINFGNGFPGPLNTHFANSPTAIPGPLGPIFTTSPSRPQNGPFHTRPNAPPTFASRPLHFNGPPRNPFHSGPQRPFHVNPQPQPFFDDPKYLQENYHTITNEQVDPPKEQVLPNRQNNFNFIPRPSPAPGPSSAPFPDQHRPQHIPTSQQLPQQRPPQQFLDSKPGFSVGPSRPPFFNLKPSPPHIEQNAASTFQQHQSQQSQFSFHQGANTQLLSRPSSQTLSNNQHNFHASPSPSPQSQFLPQPSSTPQFNFHPSPTPDRPNFHGPSEKPPQFNQQRPHQQNNFQEQFNHPSQHNLGQFVPNGGELVAAIPKYEQHITVNNPTAQPDYSGLTGQSGQHKQPTPTASNEQQYRHNQAHQQTQQTHQQSQQQNYYDSEQEQVRLQLAQNVQKQQDEIKKLQAQLAYAQQHQQQQQKQQQQQQHQQQQQQQHQQQQQQQQQHQLQQQQNLYEQNYKQYQQQQFVSSPKPQYIQERARPQPTAYPSSTSSPPYYQSTSRTVEIKPTTQKYASSTINSINSTPEPKRQEKKKKPVIELPDEVPDDLRQQLLSSGILDNADISVLDYDKVGDTPLDSLPPDQLANFFSAGGGQQLASSEFRPIVVKPNGDKIESRIDEEEDDQEISASENVANYITVPTSKKQDVEMKVVHFDPDTMEGQNVANEYVKEDATRLDTVSLNDKKYNRYLPLKVSGNQFPLPDILKGRQVTSVVVLAPVETEALDNSHSRSERATSNKLKGIKFVAGNSLYDLLKRPTKENFEKWLDTEKKTATDQQSVILLVTAKDETASDKEIYMYDISSGKVNKLSGELSSAFVEAAENNSLSKDIELLAIEGDGIPENFNNKNDEVIENGSENVPLFIDVSGLSLNQDNQISISSGYSKTKLGRALRH